MEHRRQGAGLGQHVHGTGQRARSLGEQLAVPGGHEGRLVVATEVLGWWQHVGEGKMVVLDLEGVLGEPAALVRPPPGCGGRSPSPGRGRPSWAQSSSSSRVRPSARKSWRHRMLRPSAPGYPPRSRKLTHPDRVSLRGGWASASATEERLVVGVSAPRAALRRKRSQCDQWFAMREPSSTSVLVALRETTESDVLIGAG